LLYGQRRREERIREVGIMTDNDNFDTTEKLERTDKGFRLTVESTRGTGTRDQDKVKVEQRTEEMPDPHMIDDITAQVKATMSDLRDFDPDAEDNDD